jgi:trigger factor
MTNIENIGALERRVDLNVSRAEIAAEVAARLARLARETSMPGFRRGKVPVKMIEQAHGAAVRAEVLSDKVGHLLSSALERNRLRLAGRPRIESDGEGDPEHQKFRATFEIYPTVGPIDVSSLMVQRAVCQVGPAEVEKTIDVMRRQRAGFAPVERGARDGDRVTVDFAGTIDGTAFEGGTGKDVSFELGAGRMLPEFEAAVRGAAKGAGVRAEVHFPTDYHGAAVAGKTAQFEIQVGEVQERVDPPLDADFARSVGIASGDLEALRAEVRTSVEREIGLRLRTRTRDSVMEALQALVTFDLPKSLLADEQEHLTATARREILARGGREIPTDDVFAAAARRRVGLSLVIGEIVRANGLKARPDQVRAAIESIARGYEKPAEVVQWYLGDRERVRELEAAVVEDNALDWVLAHAKSADVPVSFDELMAGAKG